MKSGLNRRTFIRRTALTAGALSTAHFNIIAAPTPSDTLNCVQVGCGGRGMSEHLPTVIGKHNQNLYAIVDPDWRKHDEVKRWLTRNNKDASKVQVFLDYREMFVNVGKNIDAVFVTTPNHHHATVATIAMQLGKNVYCEKPVCHDVGEARKLRELARKYKVATQMGNQGHCMDGYRTLCEYIWSGAIGKVTETHSWTDRANGGVGPRPPVLPVPHGMDWDSWIGPAPFRNYHSDLHPHEWHGWYDFGNGSIGNMGCHILDGVFWALKIEHPTSIEAEYVRGGTDERYPTGSRIRWDIPAREGMPPAKVYWYEGLNKTTTASPQGGLHAAVGEARNFPPLFAELQKQYPDEEWNIRDGFTLYVGEKGVMYTGCYGDRPHIVPMEKMHDVPKPAQSLPRPKDIFTDFIEACRAGKTETSVPFEYGTRLTEFAILGNLAQHAGEGKKLEWDGPNMRVTNLPEANQLVKRENRKGWEV